MQTKQVSIKGDFKTSLYFNDYCNQLGISNQWSDNKHWDDFCNFSKNCTISKAEIIYFNPSDCIRNYVSHLSVKQDLVDSITTSIPSTMIEFKLKLYQKYKDLEVFTQFQLGKIVSSHSNCGLLIYEEVYNLLSFLEKTDSSCKKEFLKDYFQFICRVLGKNLLFIHTSKDKDLRVLFDSIPKENVIGYETPFANKNSGNKQQHYCINLNI